MALRAGVRLGVYEIVSPLGAGGMGEVYRARDAKLARDVALKLLPAALAHDTQSMARLEREARTLAALNHPSIAAIYGLEESDGRLALVMELVEGETLFERIHGPAGSSAKPLHVEEALPMARQIAEALEYAHERGVIHRDLKPANVKITPEGTVKVLDFGLAKVLSDQDSITPAVTANSPTLSAMATQAGIILGTAAYMAPEQAKGKPVDRRADIWAFGCVLFEMLAGKKPFEGETISDVLAAVIKSDPDWTALPADTPPSMRRLIRRCLQKDVRQRLQAIGDARIAIEETISGTGADADVAILGGTAEARRASRIRRALPWALGAFAVLCAATAGWLLLKPRPQPNVFRFTVAPPENIAFIAGGEMSISPDGRMLAFVAQSGMDKTTALWLRPLDSLTAQPVPGTEGALAPFWSPDSQQIGFGANGKLEKTEISGGTPQALCDVGSFGGATWNRDGVILFARQGGLYRVPDTGGTPTLVLAVDPSLVQGGYLFPQFLPDGRHFIYHETGEVSAGTFLGAGSLDSKTVEHVAKVNSEAVFAPPGYVFYVDQTTLMARPFDAGALRFTGPPVPVAQDIGSTLYTTYAYFSVSPAGVLAYETTAGVLSTQMTWFNRAGEKLGTVGRPAYYTAPALSADGTRLGVAVGWFGKRDIWVYDMKRGTASRLTFSSTDNTNTAWSADGARIVFSSNRTGQFDIYQKAANGLGSEEPVFQSKQPKHLDDLSSDGRYGIYDTATGNTELWGLPLFGDRTPFPFVQGNFSAICAQFSPNGRYVAYASTETGSLEVYVQTFPEHVGKWQISAAGGNEPVWSRDGKELFYLDLDGKLMEVDVDTIGATFQAAIPKPLFQTQLNGRYPGRTLYVVSPDAQRFLMIVPAGTAKPEPITVVVNWPALLRHGSGK